MLRQPSLLGSPHRGTASHFWHLPGDMQGRNRRVCSLLGHCPRIRDHSCNEHLCLQFQVRSWEQLDWGDQVTGLFLQEVFAGYAGEARDRKLFLQLHLLCRWREGPSFRRDGVSRLVSEIKRGMPAPLCSSSCLSQVWCFQRIWTCSIKPVAHPGDQQAYWASEGCWEAERWGEKDLFAQPAKKVLCFSPVASHAKRTGFSAPVPPWLIILGEGRPTLERWGLQWLPPHHFPVAVNGKNGKTGKWNSGLYQEGEKLQSTPVSPPRRANPSRGMGSWVRDLPVCQAVCLLNIGELFGPPQMHQATAVASARMQTLSHGKSFFLKLTSQASTERLSRSSYAERNVRPCLQPWIYSSWTLLATVPQSCLKALLKMWGIPVILITVHCISQKTVHTKEQQKSDFRSLWLSSLLSASLQSSGNTSSYYHLKHSVYLQSLCSVT